MVLAIIDSDKIAKTCPREFLRFRLELSKSKLSMLDFALFLDDSLGLILPGIDTTEVEAAYNKLIIKFKRTKKVAVSLTTEGAFDGKAQNYFMAKPAEYYTASGDLLPSEKFAGCIWVTDVEMPRYYKEIGIQLVERRR
jgi:hypothetical protein